MRLCMEPIGSIPWAGAGSGFQMTGDKGGTGRIQGRICQEQQYLDMDGRSCIYNGKVYSLITMELDDKS